MASSTTSPCSSPSESEGVAKTQARPGSDISQVNTRSLHSRDLWEDSQPCLTRNPVTISLTTSARKAKLVAYLKSVNRLSEAARAFISKRVVRKIARRTNSRTTRGLEQKSDGKTAYQTCAARSITNSSTACTCPNRQTAAGSSLKSRHAVKYLSRLRAQTASSATACST